MRTPQRISGVSLPRLLHGHDRIKGDSILSLLWTNVIRHQWRVPFLLRAPGIFIASGERMKTQLWWAFPLPFTHTRACASWCLESVGETKQSSLPCFLNNIWTFHWCVTSSDGTVNSVIKLDVWWNNPHHLQSIQGSYLKQYTKPRDYSPGRTLICCTM